MRYPANAALNMDPLSIDQIAQFAGAVRQNGRGATAISHLSTDSRTTGPGDLFVALIGDNFDGHKFVNDAFLRGAAVLFVVAMLLRVAADFLLLMQPHWLNAASYAWMLGALVWSWRVLPRVRIADAEE